SVEIIGQDTASDNTAFSIPIYLIFPEQMTEFFGAVPREDFSQLGSCVITDNEGKVTDVLQRNLVSSDPAGCNGAPILNPYSEVYGHSDFNMRMLSTLYAAAYFQTNYSMNWFDVSNIYIAGRGYTPEAADGFEFESFSDSNGLTYSAMRPTVFDEFDEEYYVGIQMIRDANAMQAELAQYLEDHNGVKDSDYYSIENDLDNLIEQMRLTNQANEIFEGYNVFLPSTL
ncbi:MAG: hypothetical protein KC561_14215, partial [Myxococcales bacterium]|nr:hypothetical protein [Myxococcales bacterium]